MKPIISSAYVVVFAIILTLLTASPASAGGVVTDCTTYGPGPGTLATAVETDGLVTFACSGTIVVRDEIPVPDRHLAIDGSGQTVILSGGNQNRLFNVGAGSTLQLHRITLTGGNAGSNGGGAIIERRPSHDHQQRPAQQHCGLWRRAGDLQRQRADPEHHVRREPGPGPGPDTGGGGAINQYFNFGDGNNNPNENPNVVIQNSTFAYNYAARAGREGIWQENGKLQLRYNVIAHNGAGNCKIDASQQVDPVLLHGQPRRRRHLLAGRAGRPRPPAAGQLWREHAHVCAAAQQSRHRRRARQQHAQAPSTSAA